MSSNNNSVKLGLHKLPEFVLLFTITSCVTPYQPLSFSGGFTDFEIGDGKYLVTYSGNGNTHKNTVRRYAYRRAKEICNSRGFGDFEHLGEEKGTDISKNPDTHNCTAVTNTRGYTNESNIDCTVSAGREVSKHSIDVVFTCRNFLFPPEIFGNKNKSLVSLIPDGSYELIGSGDQMKLNVQTIRPEKYSLILSGSLKLGNSEYTCDPRAWEVTLNEQGAALEVKRTKENCTQSIPSEVWEKFKRAYMFDGDKFLYEFIQQSENQKTVFIYKKLN